MPGAADIGAMTAADLAAAAEREKLARMHELFPDEVAKAAELAAQQAAAMVALSERSN